MKFLLILLILFCNSLFVFSQTKPSKSQEFANQIIALDSQGKLDDAIALAEKALKFEKKLSSGSPENLANAYLNVALLRKKRIRQNSKKIQSKNFNAEKRDGIYRKIKRDLNKAEKEFRKVLDIYEKEIKNDSLSLATAQYELVDIVYSKLGNPVFLIFEATSKDIQSGFEEMIDLYEKSLQICEKILGIENETTLTNIFVLAELHQKRVNFERSLPLYKKFVLGAEKKYGRDNKILIKPLRKIAEVLVSIEKTEEAERIIKRISKIKGTEEEIPEANYYLNNRLISPKPTSRLFTREYVVPTTIGSPTMQATSIPVNVLINENGEVIEAISPIKEKSLKKEAENNVRKWKFRPFELNGEKRKLRGVALYKRVVYK